MQRYTVYKNHHPKNKNKKTKNKRKTCKYFTSLVGEVLLHYLDPGDTKTDVKR